MEESNEHNDLLIKWLNNELSDSEKAAFEQSEDFVKYSSIINEVDQWKVPVLDLEKNSMFQVAIFNSSSSKAG